MHIVLCVSVGRDTHFRSEGLALLGATRCGCAKAEWTVGDKGTLRGSRVFLQGQREVWKFCLRVVGVARDARCIL
jgi:hypothetical protein